MCCTLEKAFDISLVYLEASNKPVTIWTTKEIPNKKPKFQRKFMFVGHGYDCI